VENPAENLMGEEKGFPISCNICFRTFDYYKCAAEYAIEYTIEYMSQREALGKQ
jgi:hypothetical protein